MNAEIFLRRGNNGRNWNDDSAIVLHRQKKAIFFNRIFLEEDPFPPTMEVCFPRGKGRSPEECQNTESIIIGMDPLIDLCQIAPDIPTKLPVLFIIEPLEFLD
jgi:hypothetical protein